MRFDQQGVRKSPGDKWRELRPATWRLVDVSPAHYGVATQTSLGVTLCIFVRWTGRLLRQVDYPWSTINALTPEARRRIFMDFFKKPLANGIPVGSNGQTPTPPGLNERAPTLAHFLCDASWPDGEERQRSTIVVFVEDGMFKACLSDKDSGTSLWASCRSFDDLLEALEARLTDDRPDWRKARQKGKRT